MTRSKPPTRSGEPHPWDRPTQEIYLKHLLAESSISQREAADAIDVSPATINLACSKRYLPVRDPGFKARVEAFIASHPQAMEILAGQGKPLAAIWENVQEHRRGLCPADIKQRQRKRAVEPGNPLEIETKEVAMLSDGARKQFKLFRHPFIDDILKDSDIFMSDEHRYIEAAMIDAAKHGGFLAVIGEVGSGKSVMRRKVIERLKKEGDILVIYPQTIDKRSLTASAICDAIIMDISNVSPRMKL